MVLNQLQWLFFAALNAFPFYLQSSKTFERELNGKQRNTTIRSEMNNYSKPIYNQPLGAEAQVMATNDRLPKANVIYIRRPPAQPQLDSTNFTRYYNIHFFL